MRFAFFTAAAVVATIAHLTEAVKLSETTTMDFDDFSQIEAVNPLGKVDPPMTVTTKNQSFNFNDLSFSGDDKDGLKNLKGGLNKQFGASCGCNDGLGPTNCGMPPAGAAGPSPELAEAMKPKAPPGTPEGDHQDKMKREKDKTAGEKKSAEDDLDREKKKQKEDIKKQEDKAKTEKEGEDKKNEDKKKEAEAEKSKADEKKRKEVVKAKEIKSKEKAKLTNSKNADKAKT